MINQPKKELATKQKQHKLYFIFYIIIAFVFIITILDIVLFLLQKNTNAIDQPLNINIQGTTQNLQQELKNLLNR
jgi:flagellar basal body-associated protein FliL